MADALTAGRGARTTLCMAITAAELALALGMPLASLGIGMSIAEAAAPGGTVANAGYGVGTSGTIPEGYGTQMTVTCLGPDGWHLGGSAAATGVAEPCRTVWSAWVSSGAAYSDGIAVMGGRYLCACTEKYGTVGDKITFYLSDGTAIPCIMLDTKNSGDPDCNEWGHDYGATVLELEVDRDYYNSYGNPASGTWMPNWSGKRVASWTNEGRYL